MVRRCKEERQEGDAFMRAQVKIKQMRLLASFCQVEQSRAAIFFSRGHNPLGRIAFPRPVSCRRLTSMLASRCRAGSVQCPLESESAALLRA